VDERRHSPGRRERDHIVDWIWRELDALKADLVRDIERLERDLELLEQTFQLRVKELEVFHIEERTKLGQRLHERDEARAEGLRLSQKVGIAVGVVGTLAAIVEPFLLR
jgi:hypothetical protein